MKKTKKTHLTTEVRDALLAIRNIPWESFPLEYVGYAPKNYAGVRRVLMDSMLNIQMVAKYMVMLSVPEFETEHIKLSVKYYSGDVEDLDNATFDLKTNLAAKKPADITWREIGQEYGYADGSGTFSRAIKARKWAPIEMMYLLCKRFDQKVVVGRSKMVVITFTVKK